MNDLGFSNHLDLTKLPSSGRVVVGLSGGADSMSLAHSLIQRIDKDRIICAHLHHMLRDDEADRDAKSAEEFCKSFGLKFSLKKVDIKALAKKQKLGLEVCGRESRYLFFHEFMNEDNDRILTAHNADDNVETVLMNLTRGAAISGFCGIPYQNGCVLRPLLGVSRREIEEYCKVYELPYVLDSTNFEVDFVRNKIRNLIVPVLTEINPNLTQSVMRSTQSLSIDRDYLNIKASELLAKATRTFAFTRRPLGQAGESFEMYRRSSFIQTLANVNSSGEIKTKLNAGSNKSELAKKIEGLHAPTLKAAHRSVLLFALKMFIEMENHSVLEPQNKDKLRKIKTTDKKHIERKHLETIADNMHNGFNMSIPGNRTVSVSGDLLFILKSKSEDKETRENFEITLRLGTNELAGDRRLTLTQKYGSFDDQSTNIHNLLFKNAFDYDTIAETMVARNRREGDRFAPLGRHLSKSLKKLLIEMKVPHQLRDHLVLIACGCDILYVEGQGVSENYRVTDKTRRAIEITLD